MSSVGARLGLGVAVALACSALVAVLAGVSPGAQASGQRTLAPDLVTLPIGAEELVVEERGGRIQLRLSNEVANRGPGPLEVFPSPESTGCDGDGDTFNDRSASQRLYGDQNTNGTFDDGADTVVEEREFGCIRFHPAHDHWHTLDFSRYQLLGERSGRLVRSREKVGFCLGDRRLVGAVPPAAGAPVYPHGAREDEPNCDERATQGISVGWADLYAFNLPGQELGVGRLRRGSYCLSSLVDPRDELVESEEDNNERELRIELRPRRLEVRKLKGDCRV